jgi:hypothetical protein
MAAEPKTLFRPNPPHSVAALPVAASRESAANLRDEISGALTRRRLRRINHFAVSPFLGAVLLIACGKKVDVPRQAGELEKAFQASPSSEYVSVAISAVRTNNYAGGVVALQSVRRMPGMTADQLMAVQRTLETIMADLVARADKGDVNAQADLAAIERSRSQ